jgi:hypothetical protein
VHDSAFGRLIAVLISPTRTFQSIAQRPTWAVPLIVLLVLNIGVSVLVFQRVDMQEVIARDTARQGQELTDQQIEQFAGVAEKFGLGCFAVVPPIGYLLFALVLMVVFKVAGGEIGFPASFSVTLHAMMPWAVASLITIPVALGTEAFSYEQIKASSFIASSAAAFAPEGTGPVLLTLLSAFDLFSFWTMALLAIGFSIVARVSRGKAAVTVIALWAVYVAFRVGMAALGGLGGGAG